MQVYLHAKISKIVKQCRTDWDCYVEEIIAVNKISLVNTEENFILQSQKTPQMRDKKKLKICQKNMIKLTPN